MKTLIHRNASSSQRIYWNLSHCLACAKIGIRKTIAGSCNYFVADGLGICSKENKIENYEEKQLFHFLCFDIKICENIEMLLVTQYL